MKMIFSRMFPIFLYFLKYVGDKYGDPSVHSWLHFWSPQKCSKTNAIDPESLIRHFGIIKTPYNPHNYIKKPRNTNKSTCFCLILGLIRPRFGPLGEDAGWLAGWLVGWRWQLRRLQHIISYGSISTYRLTVNFCKHSKFQLASYEWWPRIVGRAGGGQKMGHFYGTYH